MRRVFPRRRERVCKQCVEHGVDFWVHCKLGGFGGRSGTADKVFKAHAVSGMTGFSTGQISSGVFFSERAHSSVSCDPFFLI